MATGGCDLLPSVQTLLQNPQHVFMETSEVLLRIGNNILENPGIPKYRRLKVSNATITQKLLPVCGAVECLIEMGFQEVRHSDTVTEVEFMVVVYARIGVFKNKATHVSLKIRNLSFD